ncbi:putative GUN4 domain containing protein [Halomicronema hongdechloris C2206]|uniref:GUN4 domain containing protein n=1 Tax=Halomicronema hongdechloris C2206 TaxID=1641165 RepID=A0A1Z3HL06_9CYAN|nr:GUN4 domain-containing protein [Halomicronema hongdechloris]ASC70956.1 putative GUN4 domain containing protein [Halomicronema hongdechloris C2206]
MGKYALLIGVGEYGKGLQPLPAAPNDVAALQKVLQEPTLGGFDQVKVIINPSHATIAREIELWFQGRKPDDLVVLFFSGHGVKDERRDLYFAACNTEKVNNRLVRSTATSARFVHDCVRSCQAKYQVLILDCCFSGAFGDLMARDDGDINLTEQLGAEGRVVLTSTSAVDYSFEEKGADLSIYTRYLVEGIVSGAADEDEDGVITVDELHHFAGRKVRDTSPAMSPKMITLKDEGYRIRLARSPQDDPRVKYRKEAEKRAATGQFSIPAKRLLRALRQDFGLSDTEAEAIEAEVLKPFQEYQRKRQEYQDTLQQCLQTETPLSPRIIQDLADFRAHLRLKPEDVAAMERAALNGRDLEEYALGLERQRLGAARRRQQQAQEEAERRRQAETDRQRQATNTQGGQPEATDRDAASRRPKTAPQSTPPRSSSQSSTATSDATISRQQFLKWVGLGGVGILITFGINQALKDVPLSSSPNPALPEDAPSEGEALDPNETALESGADEDYRRLAELLDAGQWKEADEATRNIMLKVANRESEGWLDSESLETFPCNAVLKLDQLWVDASDGQFGFSVQKAIYVEECGGSPDGEYDEAAWQCFGDRVGWRVDGNWIGLSDVTLSTAAPSGHLPPFGFWLGFFGFGRAYGIGSALERFELLFSRATTCKL